MPDEPQNETKQGLPEPVDDHNLVKAESDKGKPSVSNGNTDILNQPGTAAQAGPPTNVERPKDPGTTSTGNSLLSSVSPSTEPAMEIHTHGHVHQDKKWKEYLFQFIMLFLAVTAGFFMENQREHYVERHRAHELAHSLVGDLKADTAEIRTATQRLLSLAASADLIINEINKPEVERNDSLIQTNIYRLNGYDFFDAQQGTYQQIKSSGALRYFRSDIALLLTKYETGVGYLARLTADAMAYRVEILMPFTTLLQNGNYLRAYQEKQPYHGIYFLHEPDSETVNGLINRALNIRTNYLFYAGRYEIQRLRAIELIDALESAYPND